MAATPLLTPVLVTSELWAALIVMVWVQPGRGMHVVLLCHPAAAGLLGMRCLQEVAA
jgi:hypothetical protein